MNKKALPYVLFVIFLFALSMLAFTTVSGAMATIQPESADVNTDLQMNEIDVAILESPDGEEWRQLDGEAFASLSDNPFVVGKEYENQFMVENTGEMPIYARVVIYRYWLVEEEASTKADNDDKDFQLDGGLIELIFPEESGWMLDTKNSTREKTILIYPYPIGNEEGNNTSDVFLSGLRVDSKVKESYSVASQVTKDGYTTIVYEYTYDGRKFKVVVEADAVQTHHGEDAIKSAWGRNVSINNDGIIELDKEG